jgi:hypothetical protein
MATVFINVGKGTPFGRMEKADQLSEDRLLRLFRTEIISLAKTVAESRKYALIYIM